jgi:hypothetical protein
MAIAPGFIVRMIPAAPNPAKMRVVVFQPVMSFLAKSRVHAGVQPSIRIERPHFHLSVLSAVFFRSPGRFLIAG